MRPTRTTAMLTAGLAAVALTMAACGSGDSDTQPAPGAPPASEAPGAEPLAGAGGGSSITVTADPSGSLDFVESSVSSDSGEIDIELVNDSSVVHDLVIERDGSEVVATDRVTGGRATATAELEPGEYAFYCSVTGHRTAGMEGTLTVR